MHVCACVLLCAQHSGSETFISVGNCLCLSDSAFSASSHKNGEWESVRKGASRVRRKAW